MVKSEQWGHDASTEDDINPDIWQQNSEWKRLNEPKRNCSVNKESWIECKWYMFVIPAHWEYEAGGLEIWVQAEQFSNLSRLKMSELGM